MAVSGHSIGACPSVEKGPRIVNPDPVSDIEDAFRAAWTGHFSTPFIADLHLPAPLLEAATAMVRKVRLKVLFARSPTLAVWAVLYPLSRNYGATTSDVYLHISRFTGEDYSDVVSRDALKSDFRRAARKIGLPVHGNDPSTLFFAPLGPPRARHGDLAQAFVDAALKIGPPAIEDTLAARSWQRRAVDERCSNLPRLRETVQFDTSAHCARQFEAWRQGKPARGESETHLFSAYDRAAKMHGRSRTDIIGPPRILWLSDDLGLEAEPSRLQQSMRLGAFPTRMPAGQKFRVPAPWPEKISWSAGTIRQEVPFAPSRDEVLVFDADSGTCFARVDADQVSLDVPAENLLILSRSDFTSPSFGAAIPTRDPAIKAAWIAPNETLEFEGRGDLHLLKPQENAIWLDGVVLGRDGGRALYASDAALVVHINPEIGGASRIVRARFCDIVRYMNLSVAQDGSARVDLSTLGLSQPNDPCEVIFDILAPGAAGDLEARAELSTRCWIWPGVATPVSEIAGVRLPGNFNAARSGGLRIEGDKLSIDPRSDVEVPILGLKDADRVREFALAARSEKLWHCRILPGDRVYVPRGKILLLGPDNRHDTLTLRSQDRDASLLILGVEKRRPFFKRNVIEIPASELEPGPGGDDRIAVRRRDGRVDILARLHRVHGFADLTLDEDDHTIRLSLAPRRPMTGLRARIETVSGQVIEGDYSFNHDPGELVPLTGIFSRINPATGRVDVEVDRSIRSGSSRILFDLRVPGGALVPLTDGNGTRVAIGLSGPADNRDLKTLTALARFLAQPEPEALSGQLSAALMPAYQATFDVVGVSRMAGSIKPVLNVVRADGAPPRHDLVGVAPWIFEAPATAFAGLHDDSGLAPLARMSAMTAPDALSSLNGDKPLVDWLKRVGTDTDIPAEFGVGVLQHAFRALRHRLRDSDLHDLVSDGPLGNIVKVISDSHIEGLDDIRSFDTNGGGNPVPARIAAQVERYARACAERRSDAFVNDIVFRTGLSRADIGRVLTMMLRAAIEFFVYFRALWSHALHQQAVNT